MYPNENPVHENGTSDISEGHPLGPQKQIYKTFPADDAIRMAGHLDATFCISSTVEKKREEVVKDDYHLQGKAG